MSRDRPPVQWKLVRLGREGGAEELAVEGEEDAARGGGDAAAHDVPNPEPRSVRVRVDAAPMEGAAVIAMVPK